MVGLIIPAVISVIIGVLWAYGVDNMNEKYPDYKGGDFLDWDDNKAHTEDKL